MAVLVLLLVADAAFLALPSKPRTPYPVPALQPRLLAPPVPLVTPRARAIVLKAGNEGPDELFAEE